MRQYIISDECAQKIDLITSDERFMGWLNGPILLKVDQNTKCVYKSHNKDTFAKGYLYRKIGNQGDFLIAVEYIGEN
ncbi:MAG: hypothetical protein F6K38_32800 [Moorea sp. SIO3B2]|nr:hypothetical protein [Moorena sp. SIO3B2]